MPTVPVPSAATSLRPQTAQQRRPMTAQQLRPLGRMDPPVPLRQEVAAHGSNPHSVVAAIKGELLSTQRRIDTLVAASRSDHGSTTTTSLTPTTAEMQFLERHLVQLVAVTGDELLTANTINTLLEMLLQRLNRLCIEALQCCGENIDVTSPPGGRIGGITSLVAYVESLGERKRMWDRLAPEMIDASSQLQQSDLTPPLMMTAMDAALNEPTASQLRRLIAEQRLLQQQLQASLEQKAELLHPKDPTAGSRDDAVRQCNHNAIAQAERAQRVAELALQEANKQRDALKKRVAELEADLKQQRQRDHSDRSTVGDAHHSSAAAETSAFVKAAGALTFASVDASVLQLVGLDVSLLPNPAVPPPYLDTESIATKITLVISEALAAASDRPSTLSTDGGRSKRQKPNDALPTPNTEGVLWWMLSTQSRVLQTLASFITASRDAAERKEQTMQAEIERLRRVITALDERVSAIKASAVRHADRARSETAPAASADVATGEARPVVMTAAGTASSPSSEHHPLVRQRVVQHVSSVNELRRQLTAAQEAARDEQLRGAATAREVAQLKQALLCESQKTAAAEKTVALLESEVQSLRVQQQQAKKELRERSASEAELSQAKWKLEIELRIAQNVIAEIRQRDEQLTAAAKDAARCQQLLEQSREEERASHAAEIAQLKEKLRESRAEAEVSKQTLKSERLKIINQEKEVDRLRGLDLQMDVLEQNFTNYAASKLAQREAAEEEDRVLQSCVESIGKDVFQLPSEADTEERVKLHLERLKQIQQGYEAEERTRRRHKATSVNWKDERSGRKQLASTMQQRYNAIQIFACEERLRRMELERRSTATQRELAEYRGRQEGLLVELAHAKSQCDTLVQRNTEAELQRKEFAKFRALAEQEIKSLKSTLHKMRVASDEQEKVLIDVGTRLQQTKNRDGSPVTHVLSS